MDCIADAGHFSDKGFTGDEFFFGKQGVELLGGIGPGLEGLVVDSEERGDHAREGAGDKMVVSIAQVDGAGAGFTGADGVVKHAFEKLIHLNGFGIGENGADVLHKSESGFFLLEEGVALSGKVVMALAEGGDPADE